MKLSKKVENITDSLTLKLNSKAVEMANDGLKVYNLTAGQLPFKPVPEFRKLIRMETSSLQSYQYSVVAGIPALRKKILQYFEKTRGLSLKNYDCLISNGGKHSLFNVLTSLIEEGDEVILLKPYWISYPEIVKICGGKIVIVKSLISESFFPNIEEIKKNITSRTKAIIINSPNNPAGIYYSQDWMQSFAELMLLYPRIVLISDEIYFSLYYHDSGPTYFYQYKEELLKQTVIVDGISKTFASTGLRIGFSLGPQKLIAAMSRLQAQTSSGANSLIQRSLLNFNFNTIENSLVLINKHLKINAELVKEHLFKNDLEESWYRSTSAFYFLFNFTKMPFYQKYLTGSSESDTDHGVQICEDILDKLGVAVIPGTPFGIKNSARISLVLERDEFNNGLSKLMKFFISS